MPATSSWAINGGVCLRRPSSTSACSTLPPTCGACGTLVCSASRCSVLSGLVAVYLITGIAGNLLSLFFNVVARDCVSVGAGASGAVFGIAGILIVLLSNKKLPIPAFELNRLRRSVIQFAVLNLIHRYRRELYQHRPHRQPRPHRRLPQRPCPGRAAAAAHDLRPHPLSCSARS